MRVEESGSVLKMLPAALTILTMCIFFTTTEVFGDNEWINMNPGSAPPARWSNGLTFDEINGVCVLFGGQDGQQEFDDTWIYNYMGNEWTEMNPPLSPPARFAHRLTFSSVDSVVVLFGGVSCYKEDAVLNDTWLYNLIDNQWIEMTPTSSPPARAYLGLVYDEANDMIVLFGGYNYETTQWFNDTWVYSISENTWTNMNPSPKPLGRNNFGMAYDVQNDVVIMYGGWRNPNMLDDTWAFSVGENTWTNMDPITSPPAVYQHDMAYDRINNNAVLFGGFDRYSMTYLNITYTYNYQENIWTDANPSSRPPARGKHRLVFDSTNQEFVLFGGYAPQMNDTWVYIPLSTGVEQFPVLEELSGNQQINIYCQNPVLSRFTSLGYFLPEDGNLSIRIFDSAGRLRAIPVNGFRDSGDHEMNLDTGDLPPGVYIVVLTVSDENGSNCVISEKFTVIR